MNGIIIINKPKGFTSFDCVALLRRVSGERHIGHTGTLDPNATGVLPVCFGKACRLIEFMDCSSKTYICEGMFGYTSDTLDAWGIVKPTDFNNFPQEDELCDGLNSFVGEIDQIPPMYAAIKVNGKKLYQYAREGKSVELKPRRVTIFGISLISYDREQGKFIFSVQCSRGTYIRSLTRDLGNMFGCGCIMTALCRTVSGGYTLENAVDIELLRNCSPDTLKGRLLPCETAVSNLKSIELNHIQTRLFLNGNPLFAEGIKIHGSAGESIACYSGNILLGIARISENNSLKAYKVFN